MKFLVVLFPPARDRGSDGRLVSATPPSEPCVRVSRSGKHVQLVTPGEYDVIDLLHVDEKRGWLYLLTSPDHPTQRYLYRVRLDGTEMERLTPAGRPGSHGYQISPGGSFASTSAMACCWTAGA